MNEEISLISFGCCAICDSHLSAFSTLKQQSSVISFDFFFRKNNTGEDAHTGFCGHTDLKHETPVKQR